MHYLSLSDIHIPEIRIRREFNTDALDELEKSIRTQGLFHPLLVQSDGHTLIAGERRLRILTRLHQVGTRIQFDGETLDLGLVPVVRLTDADAAGALEAELSENLRRQSLTWQEQASATKALHDLRVKQADDQSLVHTKTDTARSLIQPGVDDRSARVTVTEDLIVAAYLDDAEVAKAPNRKEALRVIERKLTTAHRESLAKRYGSTSESLIGRCYQGDMRAILPTIETKFDCLIADPPYGINADQMANQSAERHIYEDSPDHADEITQFLAGLRNTHMKSDSHAYIFCDARRFYRVSHYFTSFGWRVWPWPLIWSRGSSVGLLPWPEHGPRRTFECILYAISGDRRTTGVFPDCVNVPHDGQTERGAHKPPALYADLIKRSCVAGDAVLDPCCGTGPVFEAARLTNTRAVGIELDPAGYTQAVERLKGSELP